MRFTLVLFVTILMPLQAVGQDVSALLAAGRASFDEGRYADAMEVLERAVAVNPQSAEAHDILGRIYLETPQRDLRKAKLASDRAISLDPDNVKYLSLRLRRWHLWPSRILPPMQTARLESLAKRILDLDPDHSVAHQVLGEIALEDYKNARRAVSFPALDRLSVRPTNESAFNAAYLLNPVLDADGEDNPLSFRPIGRFRSPTVEFVDKGGEAARQYRRAGQHLRASVQADPSSLPAYRALMTAWLLEGDEPADALLDTMTLYMPDVADTWLFRGVIDYRYDRVGEAHRAFLRAMDLLPAEEVAAFNETGRFRREDRLSDQRFWDVRDPVLLTPENERILEHYARLVYADLRFGDPAQGRRGWETEPGDVIVRYGLPLAEAQNSTHLDKYLVLHYGDFFFKFMDLAKAGRLTFYSPKAGVPLPTFDDIDRVARNDFVLISREIFRELPERHLYDRHGNRIAFPCLASTFLGSDGMLQEVVVFGIPSGVSRATPRTGVFVVDGGGERAVTRVRDAAESLFSAGSGAETFQVYVEEVSMKPGDYSLAVEFDWPDNRETGFQRGEAISPPVGLDHGLVVSDLMLAYGAEEADAAVGAMFFRNGHAIQPAPWAVFEAGQPVYVYFEAYGLSGRAGRPGRVEVEAKVRKHRDNRNLDKAVRSLFEESKPAGVSVRYTRETRSEAEAQYLILDTRDLEEGTYLVGLRLREDVTGAEAFSGRVLVVR